MPIRTEKECHLARKNTSDEWTVRSGPHLGYNERVGKSSVCFPVMLPRIFALVRVVRVIRANQVAGNASVVHAVGVPFGLVRFIVAAQCA